MAPRRQAKQPAVESVVVAAADGNVMPPKKRKTAAKPAAASADEPRSAKGRGRQAKSGEVAAVASGSTFSPKKLRSRVKAAPSAATAAAPSAATAAASKTRGGKTAATAKKAGTKTAAARPKAKSPVVRRQKTRDEVGAGDSAGKKSTAKSPAKKKTTRRKKAAEESDAPTLPAAKTPRKRKNVENAGEAAAEVQAAKEEGLVSKKPRGKPKADSASTLGMALLKFLDPKNDVAFRRIFGTEKNKDILIHFLNDILGFTIKNAIQDIEFLSTIQDPDIASKKQSIVDVLCRDSTGAQLIIQMQVVKTKGFEKRAQYYAAKAYSRQADKGDRYQDLKEIIFIAIADCILFPDKSEYKSKHTIWDEDTYQHDLKDFYFIFIELPKFPKTKEDQLSSIVEKWIYFFKYADETSEKELEKIIGSDVIIKKAYEELNIFNWSEKEFIAYEQEIKRIRDNEAVLAQKLDDATEKGRQEGIKIGEEEGIQIGRERGILIGHEKGRQEVKVEAAKKLLKAGMSIDVIVKITGLSHDEIQRLRTYLLPVRRDG